jgi:Tfp pilus assembly protein PilF
MLQAEYQRNPGDAKVATQLAQLFDRMGQETKACEIYQHVVKLQPDAIAAAINLGTCLAKQGRIQESISLWKGVLQRSPGQEGARLNLAVAQLQTKDQNAARATLEEALRFNPLSMRARELLSRLAE